MDKIKLALSSVFSFIVGIFGALAIPILLMVSCNFVDYVTGIMAAPRRGQKITSKIGLQGIKKKIGLWLLVIVGAMLDALIGYATESVGLTIPVKLVIGCFVCIWIICNEMLSILENLRDIGVPLPAFLTKLIKYVKSQTEKTADVIGDTDDTDKKE